MSNEDKKERNLKESKREDKIFNNGYKTGEGLRNEEDYIRNGEITVHSGYSDNYLKDVYDAEEYIDYNLGVDKIFEVIDENDDLKGLLHKMDNNTKLKLSKDEINWCFTRISTLLDENRDADQFYNPIYILEALSSIININSNDPIKDYKKIFDSLTAELQEELIVELNKKYNFLNGKMVKRKMH